MALGAQRAKAWYLSGIADSKGMSFFEFFMTLFSEKIGQAALLPEG
jgi:hypothetical protein